MVMLVWSDKFQQLRRLGLALMSHFYMVSTAGIFLISTSLQRVLCNFFCSTNTDGGQLARQNRIPMIVGANLSLREDGNGDK